VILALGLLGASTMTCVILISGWFCSQRGLAIGIALVGTSLGSIILSPVNALMIERFGWRQAFLIEAALPIVLLVFILLVVRNSPKDVGTVAHGLDESGGRDLRLFGSQGEQRAAVLALLLAEQQLATERTGEQGTLFLDDVMSELDDARRRLLVRQLTSAGQAIITTTDRHYFMEEELDQATVIELPLSGSLAAGAAAPPADAAGPAPPREDAL
jgi:MFS family permease